MHKRERFSLSRLLRLVVLAIYSALWQVSISAGMAEKEDVLLNAPLQTLPGWGSVPIIKVPVNGSSPLTLIVDTGTNFALVVDRKVAGQISAVRRARKWIQRLTSGVNVKVCQVTLQVGEVFLPTAKVVVLDSLSRVGVSGIIGFEFLKRFVTTIDWKAQQFILSMSYQQSMQAECCELVKELLDENKPAVQGRVDGEEVTFLVDTGSSRTFIPDFTAAELNFKRLVKGKVILGVGVPQIDFQFGRVQSIEIGAIRVTEPVIGFPAGMQAITEEHLKRGFGILGSDVLQKFRLTIDGPAAQAHFELINPSARGWFDMPQVGIELFSWDRAVYITQVYEPSPAARAGLKLGDEVIEIDRQCVKGVNLDGLLQRLFGEEGTTVTITVRRKGKRMQFDLTREKLL